MVDLMSLILLIPLAKLMNQKKGIYSHRILYPLWLEPTFPNDARTLWPKASLEPNQILNWLKECKNGKYNLLSEQKPIFGKLNDQSGPRPMYVSRDFVNASNKHIYHQNACSCECMTYLTYLTASQHPWHQCMIMLMHVLGKKKKT